MFCKGCERKITWGDHACPHCGSRQPVDWLARAVTWGGMFGIVVGAWGAIVTVYGIVKTTGGGRVGAWPSESARAAGLGWTLLVIWCVFFAFSVLVYVVGRALVRRQRPPAAEPESKDAPE